MAQSEYLTDLKKNKIHRVGQVWVNHQERLTCLQNMRTTSTVHTQILNKGLQSVGINYFDTPCTR